MTRLDLARDNFAGALLGWLEGELTAHQLDAIAHRYAHERSAA